MQVKWEQISVSTFVLYLCEVLGFYAPVWERDLQACWLRFPKADTGPALTTNHLHLHCFSAFAPSEMAVFLKRRSRSRAQAIGKKKAPLKLALRKCFMTIGSTYKPRSVRSWLDEASKAIIGAIIHLDPTSPRGSSSLPEAQEERAAPRPHKRVLPLLGLAPGGGCLAADIAAGAGGLLHHLFTLASKRLAP